MSIIWDVKSIRRKLERQEQKAEFEEKNPPVDLGMYGYPSNLTTPLQAPNWPVILDAWGVKN